MIFSRHLFKESLRQSRALGIVFILSSVFFTGISAVISLFEHRGDDAHALISASSFSGALSVTAMIFPIFFVIKLFDYLFKRGASDFYHALPFTRQCLYVTNLVVCILWYVIGLAVSILFNTFIFAIDKVVVFKTSFIFTNFIVYFIIMLQVTGAMLVAVSAMGKKGASAFTGMLILFLPRLIFQLALLSIDEKLGMIDTNSIFWLSPKYSLVYLASAGRLTYSSDFECAFDYIPGMISSLMIAVFFIAVGLWMFVNRKSEVAENASPSKKVETTLQVAYSLIFFFLAGSLIYLEQDWTFIIPAGIGLAVFVIYELIINRSFKKLLKSMPRLVIVLVLSVVYFGVLALAEHLLLTKIPSADEIKYVNKTSVSSYYSSFYYYNDDYYSTGYNNLLYDDIKFDSQEIRNVVAAAYAYTCENKKEDLSYNYHRTSEMALGIKLSDGGYHVRRLQFSEEQSDKINELMLEDPDYLKARVEIPDKDYYVISFKQSEHNKKIWETFEKEYNTLSDEDKLMIVNGRSLRGYYDYKEEEDTKFLTVLGYYKSRTYKNSYVISSVRMPETYALYTEFEKIENYEVIKKTVDTLKNIPDFEGSIDLNIQDITANGITFESVNLYVSFDKGRIVSVNINGNYAPSGGIKTLDEQMEDDEYYSGYDYNNAVYFTSYASDDEGRQIIDDLLACFDIDEEPGTSGGTVGLMYVYFSDYSIRGEQLDANMSVNVYADRLLSLAKKYKSS